MPTPNAPIHPTAALRRLVAWFTDAPGALSAAELLVPGCPNQLRTDLHAARIALANHEHDDLVPADHGCPACHNRVVDKLLIDEDTEEVTCACCGKRYTLNPPATARTPGAPR